MRSLTERIIESAHGSPDIKETSDFKEGIEYCLKFIRDEGVFEIDGELFVGNQSLLRMNYEQLNPDKYFRIWLIDLGRRI